MKIDRRSFLALGIGAAAGTALSPLPWKLTDDLSIWTQTWPWTPVPPNGNATYVNSACTLCPGGCGITVRKIDDRVVKIEGQKGHPVNDDGICLLGASGAQLLYGPTRVKTPMKRIGEGKDAQWKKISWNEAVSLVVDKLSEIRSKGEPQSVGCICGSDRGTVSRLIQRFLTVYGSPNFMCMPSMEMPYELTLQLTQGATGRAGFDVENSDFILSFGSGVIEGWGSPVRMFRAHSQWLERKAKLVQIEPRLSITATKADQWIAIKPGTDVALALGLACVIIEESLYDKRFVRASKGFDEWKKRILAEYTPSHVEAITGIGKTKLVALAREFARARKPLAICGRGQGRTADDLRQFMAVHALNALVGSINAEGGVWAVPETDYIHWPEPEMDRVAATGMQNERIDGAGSQKYPHTRYLLNRLATVINTAEESPLQMLLVAGANPCYSLPGQGAVREAFARIPFVVSMSSFMDETTAQADLVLPNHIYLERYEDIPMNAGLKKPLINLTRPVVEPQFDTRHSGDVILKIARQLGGHIAEAFPWDSYHTCLQQTLDDKWATLLENTYWTDADFKPGGEFETASGRFEFTNEEIKPLELTRTVEIEGEAKKYPLTLVPFDTMRLATGYIGSPPFVIKTVEDTVLKHNDVCIEINPATAEKYGLSNGQYADLKTPAGTARVRLYLYEGIMPGVIALPRGLGHTAYDVYLGDKGVNFNELIRPVEDPSSGLDAAWGIRAKLTEA